MEQLRLLGILAFAIVLMQLLGITCPIKFFTGISCPGCGMTRAWLSVLRLDFAAAWHYHPLFWLVPLVAAVYILKNRISFCIFSGVLLTSLIALVIIYLCRMLLFPSEIVVFAPKNGVIYRAIFWLKNLR